MRPINIPPTIQQLKTMIESIDNNNFSHQVRPPPLSTHQPLPLILLLYKILKHITSYSVKPSTNDSPQVNSSNIITPRPVVPSITQTFDVVILKTLGFSFNTIPFTRLHPNFRNRHPSTNRPITSYYVQSIFMYPHTHSLEPLLLWS